MGVFQNINKKVNRKIKRRVAVAVLGTGGLLGLLVNYFDLPIDRNVVNDLAASIGEVLFALFQ